MDKEVVLGNVMVDCNDEKKLQKFYGELLGWEIFDFAVDNVPEMVKKAESLGAVKAGAQFGGEDFVTMIDPSGHPFCLCH